MKIVWKTGEIEEYPLLYKLCGIQKQGVRPEYAILSAEEIFSTVRDYHTFRVFNDWVEKNLKKALQHDKGQILLE